MSQATVEHELRGFTTRLLEASGGLVEWTPEGAGTAVVPARVADLLHAPEEMIELSTTPQAGEPRSGLAVSLANDYLELAGRVLHEVIPPRGAFHIPELYLKGGDLQTALDRAFGWQNAQVKLLASRPTSVEYHTWWFFATLDSEDRYETTLAVTLNSASGVELEFPNLLRSIDIRPGSAPEVPAGETLAAAAAAARRRVLHLARDFLIRMDSRLERDRRRLNDYYGALAREAGRSRRGGDTPDPRAVAEKRRVVKLELQRKLEELLERFTIQATLEPELLARFTIPVLAVDLAVHRRRARRVHTVYWNALLKRLEPLPCALCGAGTFSAAFTDETVDLLCPACAK